MEEFPLPFVPAPTLRRYAGWNFERQKEFLRCLAETGSVTESARAVGMSPASAYRLRARAGSEQFAAAWDLALGAAGHKLLAVAIDRALNGTTTRLIHGGITVAERVAPSDRLLMWAVDRLVPRNAPAPATPVEIEQAIAAIGTDEEACPDHQADLLLADEMGARGDAIWEARQRAANVRELLRSSAEFIEQA
jgi:hypothetical protein